MEYEETSVKIIMNATSFKIKIDDNNYFIMRETVVTKMSQTVTTFMQLTKYLKLLQFKQNSDFRKLF